MGGRGVLETKAEKIQVFQLCLLSTSLPAWLAFSSSDKYNPRAPSLTLCSFRASSTFQQALFVGAVHRNDVTFSGVCAHIAFQHVWHCTICPNLRPFLYQLRELFRTSCLPSRWKDQRIICTFQRPSRSESILMNKEYEH